MKSNLLVLQNIFENDLTIQTIAEDIEWCEESNIKEFSENKGFDFVIFQDKNLHFRVYDKNFEVSDNLLHDDVISDSTTLLNGCKLIIKKKEFL